MLCLLFLHYLRQQGTHAQPDLTSSWNKSSICSMLLPRHLRCLALIMRERVNSTAKYYSSISPKGRSRPFHPERISPLGTPRCWTLSIRSRGRSWCKAGLASNPKLPEANALWCAVVAQYFRPLARSYPLTITAVAITPRIPTPLPPNTVLLEWRTIYAWLRRHRSASIWAARAADYLEIAEAKLVDTRQFVEGTLTQFSGFPFGHDHPFTYLEGKRVLGLALGELRGNRHLRDVLGMNPKPPGRRPSRVGRETRFGTFCRFQAH